MTSEDADRVERGKGAREKLPRQIQEQDIKPLDIETLRAMGRVWPEDEDVDEFLEARERWKREAPKKKSSLLTPHAETPRPGWPRFGTLRRIQAPW